MALATPCQTPGAWYETRIDGPFVGVSVKLAEPLKLTDEQAKELDANLHNAVELVLARYV